MSGGVDSSLAAALLKKQGHDVFGVFMKPYQPKGVACLWEQDRADALRVAALLDIPLKTWNFSREYEKHVTRYMLDAYRRGITPNPDVMCNKEIKFGLFFERAIQEGADFVATGHYARIQKQKVKREKRKGGPNKNLFAFRFLLCTARDSAKDQTYFLWTLKQKHLARTLFPVGGYTKPEVRALAKKFKLPTHDKKDSQGVCFIGPLDMKDFLVKNIKPCIGKILDTRRQIIGQHDGVYYYTIGQRHGLDIKDGHGPYFVVKKDIRRNLIIVGSEKDLLSKRARLTNISKTIDFSLPAQLEIKIRYRTNVQKARLSRDKILQFSKPQRAITPGQSAVFYRGKVVLGGGVIV